MTLIFSIDGNIGSGKSTLAAALKRELTTVANRPVVYLDEPVEMWESVTDEQGATALECFYRNQSKYAFSFQMLAYLAYISRVAQLKETLRKNTNAIVITERSVHTDKHVFAKMLYDDKKINRIEYSIYLKWFDYFSREMPLDGIIYIDTSPKVCVGRIKKRDRRGETVPSEYSQRCHDYHTSWITKQNNVLHLSGDSEMQDESFNVWCKHVRDFVAQSID